MFNTSQYAKVEADYRGDRIRRGMGGTSRQRTRIPFVGRIAEVNRHAR